MYIYGCHSLQKIESTISFPPLACCSYSDTKCETLDNANRSIKNKCTAHQGVISLFPIFTCFIV